MCFNSPILKPYFQVLVKVNSQMFKKHSNSTSLQYNLVKNLKLFPNRMGNKKYLNITVEILTPP